MNESAVVVLAEGFEEMEAVISIDMLRRAGIEVVTAALGEDTLVTGSRHIPLKADVSLKDVELIPDALVLPGGLPGAGNLAESELVNKFIKSCAEQKKIIAAICASPAYVLTRAGVLSGKKATCYPGDERRFAKDVKYVKEDVVVDGNVITSAGPGTAFYFALAIIQALAGIEAANKIKERALIR